MSVENVKAFFRVVAGDKNLQAKLKALDEKRVAQEDAITAEMAQIAAEAGFEFTAEHVAEVRKAAAAELSDAELRKIAGGYGCCTVMIPDRTFP